MGKVKVDFVRYDTEKTKKRKRKDLIVDAKTEYSVVEKLGRIHKNDSIVAVHEIVWGEEIQESSKKIQLPVETGRVKFFSKEKGFGFIEPDSEGEDLFFHVSALGGEMIYEDDLVEFEISKGPKGPIAVRILVIDSDK